METDIVRAKDQLTFPVELKRELCPFNEHETRFVVGLESTEAPVGGQNYRLPPTRYFFLTFFQISNFTKSVNESPETELQMFH